MSALIFWLPAGFICTAIRIKMLPEEWHTTRSPTSNHRLEELYEAFSRHLLPHLPVIALINLSETCSPFHRLVTCADFRYIRGAFCQFLSGKLHGSPPDRAQLQQLLRHQHAVLQGICSHKKAVVQHVNIINDDIEVQGLWWSPTVHCTALAVFLATPDNLHGLNQPYLSPYPLSKYPFWMDDFPDQKFLLRKADARGWWAIWCNDGESMALLRQNPAVRVAITVLKRDGRIKAQMLTGCDESICNGISPAGDKLLLETGGIASSLPRVRAYTDFCAPRIMVYIGRWPHGPTEAHSSEIARVPTHTASPALRATLGQIHEGGYMRSSLGI